eukprot:5194623-Amphidinium_carterae.2
MTSGPRPDLLAASAPPAHVGRGEEEPTWLVYPSEMVAMPVSGEGGRSGRSRMPGFSKSFSRQ